MRRATKGYKMPVKQGETKVLIRILSSELFLKYGILYFNQWKFLLTNDRKSK